MADDEWARAVDEQEQRSIKLVKQVQDIKIGASDKPASSPVLRAPAPVAPVYVAPAPVAPAPATPAPVAPATGQPPAATSPAAVDELAGGDNAGFDEVAAPKAEQSLINKLVRSRLVTCSKDLEILQRDPQSPLFSVKSFEALHLKPELLKGVYDMGFNTPSKIQETALPTLLADPPQNMIAQSQSGTGKTAAFILTMLSRVDTNEAVPQCLCLAPTYELALQIGEVCQQMARFMTNLHIVYAVRGERVSKGQTLSGQIIIGTPGTLLDWCTKLQVIDLKRIRVFVLDEADVMIDTQGHQDQSIRIQRGLADECQILFFSATYDTQVMQFAKAVVKRPVMIRLRRDEETLENIQQLYIVCHSRQDKLRALCNIYGAISIGQSMIFCHTKRAANWLVEKMMEEGHAVALLSGELDVTQRAAVIKRFRDGKEKVLITTNVSSRGIDVEQVTVVVNFDLPVNFTTGRADCETYLHRIGRTGRFGRSGLAINMVGDQRSHAHLQEIEKHFGIKIDKLDADDFDAIEKISGQ